MKSSVFVNVIIMTQGRWCGQALCTKKTSFHVFVQSSVSFEQFCREIILDYVSLFKGARNPEFLFMDDNARPHRNPEASNTQEREDINCMQWLAYSIDLNPTEHVCDALFRRVSQISCSTRTVQELKIALKKDWDDISSKDFPIVQQAV